MIKQLTLATGVLALLGAAAVPAVAECFSGHSQTTAQSDEALPQSTASAAVEQAGTTETDQTEATAATVVAAADEEAQQD